MARKNLDTDCCHGTSNIPSIHLGQIPNRQQMPSTLEITIGNEKSRLVLQLGPGQV